MRGSVTRPIIGYRRRHERSGAQAPLHVRPLRRDRRDVGAAPCRPLASVGATPALTLVSRPSWHSVTDTPLTIFQFALYILVAALIVGGRQLPRGLHAALALAPFTVSLLALWLTMDRLDFGIFDLEQASRIFAEGEGESLETNRLKRLPSACPGEIRFLYRDWTRSRLRCLPTRS